MFKEYNRLICFDSETSSLSPETGEILELGAIILEKQEGGIFKETGEIQTLVKNKISIPWSITQINHITDEMCKKDGISKKKFYELIKDVFTSKENLIIAYNTPFDIKFVNAFMKEMDKDYEQVCDTLDLLEIARDRTCTFRGNKLCDMLQRYNIVEFENSHRASDDARAALQVMREFWKEKNDIESYIRRV
jgi:DNA polymerase III subunit epsilon